MEEPTSPVVLLPEPPHSGGVPARILVVEDDPNSAFVLQKILLRTPHQVIGVAQTGQAAIELARAKTPDLVFMDINIPGGMDGIAAATHILREHDVPIIYITAYSDEATLARARRTAPFAYLLKPWRDKEVLITLEMALYKARTDRQLRANEQRLAATLGALDDAVLTADAQGRLSYFNPAAARLLGLDGDGALGRPVAEVLHLREQDTRTEIPGLIDRLLLAGFATDPAHPLLIENKHPGFRLVHVHSHPLGNPEISATGHVLILRDVTQLSHLEAGIRQTQKLEAVGRLAGGIAHDFNNLLAIINSFADLLLLKMASGDPNEKFYRNIRNAGQRGADLVAQLMTFSRRAPSAPRLVEATEVVADAQKMLRPLIREDIELAVESPPGLPPLMMDPVQLEQIIVNLFLNARDAISETGRITIRLGVRTYDESEAAKRDLQGAGDYVTLSVSDTGSGIPPEIRGQIFEPFFTTKEVGKGTGLGLAMVFSLVKQYRGHIEVESQPGRGTTFTISFPAAAGCGAAGVEGDATAGTAPGGSERILLVEDDPNFAECVKHLLDLHGYATTLFHDGEAALTHFRADPAAYDLLLTDVVLPKLSGKRVAEEIRRQRPDLRVLFMSGYEGDEELTKYEAGVARLQKPFSLNILLFRIRHLLSAPVAAG